METDLTIFLRLLIVIILAGLLGWERENSGKATGLKTLFSSVSARFYLLQSAIYLSKNIVNTTKVCAFILSALSKRLLRESVS